MKTLAEVKSTLALAKELVMGSILLTADMLGDDMTPQERVSAAIEELDGQGEPYGKRWSSPRLCEGFESYAWAA